MIGIIPARAGSKGLPGKNTALLAGKPLVGYAIEAALECPGLRCVVVTSDDPEVLALADRSGATAVERPAALAGDDCSMAEVVHELRSQLAEMRIEPGSAFCLLQPSSPLRTATHVRECIALFGRGGCESVVSVCRCENPPQKTLRIHAGRLQPFMGWDALARNRQTLEPAYRQNGAVWIVAWAAFLKHRRFVLPPAIPYVMNTEASIDIDVAADLERAERTLNRTAGWP